MPNFGLDQRKPKKEKINRTSKKPIREYIKTKFNYYNWKLALMSI
jgi:hypothetical protein